MKLNFAAFLLLDTKTEGDMDSSSKNKPKRDRRN